MRRLGYVYLILALLAGVCPVSSHESNDINVSDVWVQDVCHLNNLRNPPDFSFCGNGICENFDDEIVESCPDDCGYEPVIDHAEIGFGPYKPIPSHGDLWLSTWANGSTHDGELIFTWGDGCGAGLDWGHPDCDTFDWDSDVTDAGVVVMTGTVPDLACVMSSSGCLRTRDVPDGISGFPHTVHDDKPAGILAVDDRIYLFLVSPQREPLKGYLAYSDDDGQSWTVVEGTPWVQESPNSERSYFRCPMVINMGKNYSLNTDGYVYFLSIGWAWDWDIIGDGRVYLARVPVDSIITYGAYRYFGGMNGSEPIWIENPDAAVPVDGLVTTIIGSAIYHPGIERYLFLDSTALYEAEHP
ncbi:DUF4185 domain-containing protein, partial [bacterium]|nr:DUF4185 domain-containing protein [candidate division CSSED10-310 bacterium]